jgi:hypothetical protein
MAKDYKIDKARQVCTACGEDIPEGSEIVAIARMSEGEIVREDYHVPCWVDPLDREASKNLDILGVWRTTIPEKEAKKKLLVDDGLLINFFERLAGQEQPDRINFRFVLALILMRKKLLNYEGMDKKEGRDVWKMRFKNETDIHEVIDPGMDEEKIASVSASLGEIMEGDFDT